jgi:hypothetical protein
LVCIWSTTLSCLLIPGKFHKVSNLKCLFISTSIASSFQIWAENLWIKTVAHWRCRTYGTWTVYTSKAPEFTPDIWRGSPFSTFRFLFSVLKIFVWSCFLVLLTIILCVVLRRTAFDCPSGMFKLCVLLCISFSQTAVGLNDWVITPPSILKQTNVRPDTLKRFEFTDF